MTLKLSLVASVAVLSLFFTVGTASAADDRSIRIQPRILSLPELEESVPLTEKFVATPAEEVVDVEEDHQVAELDEDDTPPNKTVVADIEEDEPVAPKEKKKRAAVHDDGEDGYVEPKRKKRVVHHEDDYSYEIEDVDYGSYGSDCHGDDSYAFHENDYNHGRKKHYARH
jgi:hypothetical protein